MKNSPKRIAIACQGGGSHTAFTAGVLKKILHGADSHLEIIALSGTSGGAICAVLTWYGLLTADKIKASQLLDNFWQANSATSWWDLLVNANVVNTTKLRNFISLPEFNPNLHANSGQQVLRHMLARHIDFSEMAKLAVHNNLACLVGAVDVLAGSFKVFKNGEINLETLLASTAIPSLFRAVHANGRVYWDGLFSQNPPIRELTQFKPDEIWVIQVTPQTAQRVPVTLEAIKDRRDELTSNLSLEQEIYFINKINTLINAQALKTDKYRVIKVRRIEMLHPLDFASKLDRSVGFIKEMMAYGEEEAANFLNDLDKENV
jgi:NTE family protein